MFENWIESFLGLMNMSAGVIFFTKYMDTQMLACLQRLERGAKFCTNLFTEWNIDFRCLYRALSIHKTECTHVFNATRLDFDPGTFIKLYVENQRLSRQLVQVTNSSTSMVQSPQADPISLYGELVILRRNVPSLWEASMMSEDLPALVSVMLASESVMPASESVVPASESVVPASESVVPASESSERV
jgi:hypothetical protein